MSALPKLKPCPFCGNDEAKVQTFITSVYPTFSKAYLEDGKESRRRVEPPRRPTQGEHEMNDEDIKRPSILSEAESSVALDGDTHCVDDFPNVAFWGICEEHLKHAREKHPFFANHPSVFASSKYDKYANEVREILKGEVSVRQVYVDTILEGEVNEFLAELARGDLDRAREEAADIVAVLLRALSGDIKPAGNEG